MRVAGKERERIRTCMITIVSGSSELLCTDWVWRGVSGV